MRLMSLSHPQAQIRCREIQDGDFPAVAELLSRSFTRPELQLRRLRRLAERDAPGGLPKIGYLLESKDALVGVILMICSTIAKDGMSIIRCNLSSWHVEPDYRAYAPLLIAQALKYKGVTYVNVSARPATWPIVEAQGFSRYSKGVFIAIPALSRGTAPARLMRIRPGMALGDDIGSFEGALLSEHAGFGCLSILCRAADGAHPFVFARRDLKGVLPSVQLVYCRSIEDFVRHARRIGWYLAARGICCVQIDANGPIAGLTGRYFSDRMPKFVRGGDGPRQGDLAYTNIALFGDL
jgi:hypothetical protein